MKKTRHILTAFLLVCTAAVSCNDNDFLTEKPKYFYTIDNVFSTSAQVDLAGVSCYSKVRKYYNLRNDGKRHLLAWKGNNGTDLFDVPTTRKSLQFNNYAILTPETGDYQTIFSDFY